MARTVQQEKITLVIRQDLMDQAQAESEVSSLAMAELIRRAIDLYLTTFPVPTTYGTGELLPETETDPPTPVRKLPIHINTGLLGELDRYALQVKQSPDEVANRALVLYHGSLQVRREAAENLSVDLSAGDGAVTSSGARPASDSEQMYEGGMYDRSVIQDEPTSDEMDAAGWDAPEDAQEPVDDIPYDEQVHDDPSALPA